MVRQLRAGKGQKGLILANGGVVTYQHAVCLSRQPPRDGRRYPSENPLPASLVGTVPAPEVEAQPEGEAVVEVSVYIIVLGHIARNRC